MSSNNTKQTQNHVNDAWNKQFDSGRKTQTVKLFLMILVALRLGFDCNTFLGTPAID